MPRLGGRINDILTRRFGGLHRHSGYAYEPVTLIFFFRGWCLRPRIDTLFNGIGMLWKRLN
jgi:hypothetical protein